jgi:hypothetical protein
LRSQRKAAESILIFDAQLIEGWSVSGFKMNESLLTVGLACLIAAVTGGGLKAFGIELPLIASFKRQLLIGLIGIGLIVGAIATRGGVKPTRSTETHTAEAQHSEPPQSSINIGKIEQKTENGSSVAGVQGNVTIESPTPKPEQKTHR